MTGHHDGAGRSPSTTAQVPTQAESNSIYGNRLPIIHGHTAHVPQPGAQATPTVSYQTTVQPVPASSDSIYFDRLPIVHGNTAQPGAQATPSRSRQSTALLSLAVEEKDSILREKDAKIQALEQKLEKIQAVRQEESRHNEIVGLRDQLGRMVEEHQSLREEAERMREQLLRAEDVPLYEMTCNPHGLALVIVNEFFDPNPLERQLKLERREGAERDLQLFQQTFTHLNYQVEAYRNLTSFDMYKVLDEVGKRDHSSFDSFVCCISTHGDEHVMYGKDSVGVKRAEFDRPLKTCRSLIGKPKMFFIQACRRTSIEQVKPDCPSGLTLRQPRIPLDRDVFQANATTSLNASYRSPRDGSWFVTALHQVFTTQADFRTLIPMMYEVNKLVTNSRGVLVDCTEQEVVQCAECTTTFTKGVRFRQAMTPQQFQQLQ